MTCLNKLSLRAFTSTILRRFVLPSPVCLPWGVNWYAFRMQGTFPPDNRIAEIKSGPANHIGSSEVRWLIPMFWVTPLKTVRAGRMSSSGSTRAKNLNLDHNLRSKHLSNVVFFKSRRTASVASSNEMLSEVRTSQLPSNSFTVGYCDMKSTG